MKISEKDFIEIEFTGKTLDGEIFDSNIIEDLKKSNLNLDAKPLVFCIGQGMFLKGIEDFLIEKGVGDYDLELSPEKAFGFRNSKLVQMIPIKVFMQQKLNPVQGMMYNFDGRLAKILTVSGGRVMVDFNNPLAGKIVKYHIKVLRKIEDLNEKIKSFNDFLFKKIFDFEVSEGKLVMKAEKEFAKILELFKDKFKEIFNLDLEIIEVESKKEEKSPKVLENNSLE